MAKEINVLVVEPGKAPRPAKVKNTLETFSEIVGGPVEAGCYLPQRVMLICQENGKQRGLPPNRANPRAGNYIAGTFLLCGFEDDSFISLTPAQQMEFPEMYAHIAKVGEYLYQECGLHITALRHPRGFEYFMLEVPQQKKAAIERRITMGQPLYGYGWPGVKVRWCTGQLKTHLITKEVNRLKGQHQLQQYVGIAADEAWRYKGLNYPLVDWGITEAQALQICYDRGFDFGGLYEIYHRASCWCCPLQ